MPSVAPCPCSGASNPPSGLDVGFRVFKIKSKFGNVFTAGAVLFEVARTEGLTFDLPVCSEKIDGQMVVTYGGDEVILCLSDELATKTLVELLKRGAKRFIFSSQTRFQNRAIKYAARRFCPDAKLFIFKSK